MKLKKLFSKRAVSPVIAVVLIIALTVAAAALVYFLVIPMLQGSTEVFLFETEYFDENDDYYVDKMILTYKNIGSKVASASDLKIFKDDIELEWNNQATFPNEIKIQGTDSFILDADPVHNDVFTFTDRIYAHLYFGDEVEVNQLSVPSKFSPFNLLYFEDFSNYSDGSHLEGWNYNFMAHHSGGTHNHNIQDWTIRDGVLYCDSNDCAYLIKTGDDYIFGDVNISFELNAPTDDSQGTDINGIIFRYAVDNGVPKYYLVAYTNDHTLTDGRNGPHFPNGDTMQKNTLYLFYVEGSGGEGSSDGSLTILAETPWTRNNDQWYNYTVIAQGDNIQILVDGELKLEAQDNSISVGQVGIMSGALLNSQFDNILVWTGTKT